MYKVYRDFIWRDSRKAKPLGEKLTGGISCTPGWHRVRVRTALELGDKVQLTVEDSFSNSLTTLVEGDRIYSPKQLLDVQVQMGDGWSVDRLVSGSFELIRWVAGKAKRSGAPSATYTEAAKPALDAGERKSYARIVAVRAVNSKPPTGTPTGSMPDYAGVGAI